MKYLLFYTTDSDLNWDEFTTYETARAAVDAIYEKAIIVGPVPHDVKVEDHT